MPCGMSQAVMRASVPMGANAGAAASAAGPGVATSSPRVIRHTPNGVSSLRHALVISM